MEDDLLPLRQRLNDFRPQRNFRPVVLGSGERTGHQDVWAGFIVVHEGWED